MKHSRDPLHVWFDVAAYVLTLGLFYAGLFVGLDSVTGWAGRLAP